jgi:hypothetical protein
MALRFPGPAMRRLGCDVDGKVTKVAEVPAEPVGLGAAGKKLWQSINSQWTLDADEQALLAQACVIEDEIIRMRLLLAKSDLVVPGSTGQLVTHPLIAAIGQSREQMRRLITSIRAPAQQAEPVAGSVISDAARAAAAARWRRAQHGS